MAQVKCKEWRGWKSATFNFADDTAVGAAQGLVELGVFKRCCVGRKCFKARRKSR